MRIVILNNDIEAFDYSDNHRNDNDIVIPLGVTARSFALENNWQITTLSSLISDGDYLQAKLDSEKRIKSLVEELNKYSISVAKNFPLTIGDYFHFQLHVAIGQIHLHRHILDSIEKKFNPELWILYQYENENTEFRPHSFISFCEIFLKSPYKMQGKILKLNDGFNEGDRNQLKKNWKQKLKQYFPERMIFALNELRFILKYKQWNFLKKNKLFQIGALYDWSALFMDKIFKKSYFVNFNQSTGLIKSDNLDNNILAILNKSITFENVPVFDLTDQAKTIKGTLKFFDAKVLKLINKIKKYDAIISTVFVFPMENLFGHIANFLNKPVINWQHGEMNLYDDIFTEFLEVKYTTHYFCYGKEVAPLYESYIGEAPMKKVYIVGNNRNSIKGGNGDLIIYATGKWLSTGTPFIDSIDPDSRLFDAQSKILKYLESLDKSHEIIFKPNPGPNTLPFELKNVKIEYDKSFIELLENAKLVILDTPATTCVETAATKVPLFILSGRAPWYDKPMQMIKKRAIVKDKPSDLTDSIDKYLKEGYYPADTNNKEFLDGWGSSFKTEDVKKNAMEILNDIL